MREERTEYWQAKLRALEVVVIIPTYNNEKTLAGVLDEVRHYAPDIIVVNDGSTDKTAQIVNNYPDLLLITHPKNKGKGTALKSGLSLAKKKGFRYAVTIDSDGQHFASDIPLFINEIEKNPDFLLVGARNLEAENMPGKNTFANKFSNFWFKLETGIELQDTQSGYRLYPVREMGSLKYYTSKYEFELEAIVFGAWKGISVKNIGIRVYYPPEKERVSHFRPFRDFTRISILNTFLVLLALLWIWPRNFFRKLSWQNIKSFFYKNVFNSGESDIQMTLSVMLGVFIGIIPAWGYQTLLALVLSKLFKLNTVITIVASNISLPPMIPFILYGSYATGCVVLGRPIVLNFTEISLENIRMVLEQYLLGSILFGVVCSVVIGFFFEGILTTYRKIHS
jgi:glycosyltransferase involved in cell wall biosynthesis